MVYALAPGSSRVTLETGSPEVLRPIGNDYKKVKLADPTPDDGIPITQNTWDIGRPILPDHVPTALNRSTGTDIPLSDYTAGIRSSAYVSQAFKDLVESVEPGIHQFFPLKVKKMGRKVIGQLFLFIVCQRLDTLAYDACVPPVTAERPFYRPSRDEDGQLIWGMVFSREKMGNAQIWVDKRTLGIWMSDALRDAIRAEGLTGIYASTRWEDV